MVPQRAFTNDEAKEEFKKIKEIEKKCGQRKIILQIK